MQCQICQTTLPPGARICPHCGAPTPYNVLEPELPAVQLSQTTAQPEMATERAPASSGDHADDATLLPGEDNEQTIRVPSGQQAPAASSISSSEGEQTVRVAPAEKPPVAQAETGASELPSQEQLPQQAPAAAMEMGPRAEASEAGAVSPPAGGQQTPSQSAPTPASSPPLPPQQPFGAPWPGQPTYGMGAQPGPGQQPQTFYSWQAPPQTPPTGSPPSYPPAGEQFTPQFGQAPSTPLQQPAPGSGAPGSWPVPPSQMSPPAPGRSFYGQYGQYGQPGYGPGGYGQAGMPVAPAPFGPPPRTDQPSVYFGFQSQPAAPFVYPGQPVPAGQEAAPTPPAQPRRGNTVMVVIILSLVIIVIVAGLFAYLGVIRPNQERAAATATAQSATATTTALLSDPQHLYTFITAQRPAVSDSLSSQSGNNWDDTRNQDGSGCQFSGGALHVLTSSAQPNWLCIAKTNSYSNLAYQVNLTLLKGAAAGIIFRFNLFSQRSYLFTIGVDGSYALSKVESNGAFILAAGSSSSIHMGFGQSNLLTVIAQGNTFFLYVNKQFVGSGRDSDVASGYLGVFAGSQPGNPGDAAFSNAMVWTLP
jgi:hypothetical protein